MKGFIDTHCHIHEVGAVQTSEQSVAQKWADAGKNNPEIIIADAKKAGVQGFICVGTTPEDSEIAIRFVQDRPDCYVSIGIHPHEAEKYIGNKKQLQLLGDLVNESKKVVAVGECGLDYYYLHSAREDQKRLLRLQIELAVEHNLPLIFHVRDAFEDFWPIFDSYNGLRGVLHSFTADSRVLKQALSRGLYIGLNGIMTFTKNEEQLLMAKTVPLDSLLLETDAPFLTPTPFRGTICEPKHVRLTAEFLSALRGEPLERLTARTTANAKELFSL